MEPYMIIDWLNYADSHVACKSTSDDDYGQSKMASNKNQQSSFSGIIHGFFGHNIKKRALHAVSSLLNTKGEQKTEQMISELTEIRDRYEAALEVKMEILHEQNERMKALNEYCMQHNNSVPIDLQTEYKTKAQIERRKDLFGTEGDHEVSQDVVIVFMPAIDDFATNSFSTEIKSGDSLRVIESQIHDLENEVDEAEIIDEIIIDKTSETIREIDQLLIDSVAEETTICSRMENI